MTVDFDAARQFLAALGKPKGTTRLRGFYSKTDPRKAEDRGAKGDPTKALVESWVTDGRGVYVVINNGGDKDADITECIAFFCEWDDKPKDWQVTAWKDLGLPEPTIQVDTGGKSIHNYWVLKGPVAPDVWKPIQTRLLDHADADRALKNPARVMRLPGCPHPETGQQAQVIHLTDNHYTATEFAATMPPPVVDRRQEQARTFTDYEVQGLDEVQRALQAIPPRVPGSKTYPMYRNILWGLIKAVEEAGSSQQTALSMMTSHSPEWAGIEQVADSGGADVGAGTFWYWAKEHGYRAPRKVRQGPPELRNLPPIDGREAEPGPAEIPDPEPDLEEHAPDLGPASSLPFRPLGFDHGVYYYLPAAACQVVALTAAQHNKAHFLQLATLEWWANGFGDDRGRIDWDSAANAILGSCIAQGVYDPSRVRGRGAWADARRVILHLGNRLVIDGRSHPITKLPRDFSSLYFYENAKAIDGPGQDALSDDLALNVRCIAERFRWETPASANLLLGWIVLAPVCGALDWRPHIWVTGGAGTGKAQPHSASVLTPTGWRCMGEIEVGDLVSTPDNGFARVRDKYPQGQQPTYRITFADGRSTRATGDHLWKVRVKHAWRIRTTDEMARILSTQTRQSRSLAVPLCQAMTVCNGAATSLLPLHPYALGVMLGDGSFVEGGGNNLTVFDQEIVDRARQCLERSPFNFFDTNVDGRYRLGDLSRYGKQTRQTIKDLRLLGAHSDTKFIPRAYLEAPVEDRIELLKGLMDTDGTAEKTGGISFCTVSEQLRDDVLELVRSLGGIARFSAKQPSYTHNGERRQGRTAFIISIRLPDPTIAFSLPRKLERVSLDHQYADCLYLNVVSIEPDEPEECSCIAIDHPDRLYVTDDFVVTHNTTILKSFMKPLLGGMFEGATGGTTEAGLRGQLRSDAIPVVFDELEQNEQKDKQTVQNILALARIASSEGGKIYKGTTNGGSNSFEIRSMFCVSSINVALIQRADLDRFCVLGLRKDHMDKDDWTEFEQQILETCTEENGRRLVARTLQQIPAIRKNARTLATALSRRFGQRFGDQYGTLLAGAWSLEPAGGGDLSLQQALEWINSMDWDSREVDAGDADEAKCLNHILQSLVQVDGGKRMSILELVQLAQRGVIFAIPGREHPSDEVETILGRYGLKVASGLLAVANNSTNLQAILRDTPWAGNAYRQSLRRLSGASTSTNTLRFKGSGVARATLVPLETLETV